MKIQKSLFFSIFICLLLSSCSTFWEKDNSPPPSPLVQFEPKVKPRKLWDTRINFGMNHEDLKFNPLLIHDELIILSQAGTITSLNKNTGKIQWTMEVKAKVSSGLAMNDQLLVVGTKNGEVLAFSTHDRKPLWTAHTESEILATPVLSQQLVIVKSIDGKISAFSIAEGRLIWRHQAIEPNFILRGASTPQLTSTAVVVGYANGKVEKLALKDGHALWTEALARADGAFAIQRMIDIDANPLISNNKIFAASYQGKLAALHLSKGSILWDQDLSSYVDLAADENLIYVSDADSHIQAFDQQTGRLIWKQTQLEARHITGPVLVGPYLVVGDGEGVLHWLNSKDGSFVGRAQISGRAIITKPAVSKQTVYAITSDGFVTAQRIDS